MTQQALDVHSGAVRDIQTVTTEIKTLTRAAQRMALTYAVEIGRRLKEAKGMLPHGRWGLWLKEEVDFSQSTANNFMRLFEEYAADQITLDGAVAKSQALGNLSITKALQLLALPEEERESFAKANKIETLSTREVEKLIEEKKQLARQLEEVRAEGKQAKLNLDQALADKARAVRDAAEASREEQRLRQQLKQAEKSLEEARPASIPVETDPAALEQARQAGAEEAKAQLAAQEEKLAALRHELLQAQEQAAAAVRREKLASPEVTLFQAQFTAVQEDFNRLLELMGRVSARDAAMGEKLRAALAAVLAAFGKRVTE